MKNHYFSHLCTLLILVFICDVKSKRFYVPLGERAEFSCEKTGSSSLMSWIVTLPNSSYYDTLITDDTNELRERGIVEQNSDSRSTLTIHASLENNGSILTCRELLQSSQLYGTSTVVIVIGAPLSPQSLTATATSAKQLLLEWEEHFMWPGHNISSYSIQKVSSEGVTTTLVQRTLNRYYLYSSEEPEVACVPLIFKVSAISDLGTSQPATITTGLPIRLGNFENIASQVHFKPNGTPEVTITIQPPNICEYETAAELILVLRVEGASTPLSIRTQEYSGQTQQLLIRYQTELEADRKYDLSITASSVTGNSSTSMKFDTAFPDELSSRHLHLTVVVSVCISFVTVLVLVLLFVIIFIKCRHHKHSKRDLRLDGAAGTSNYSQSSPDTKYAITVIENTMSQS